MRNFISELEGIFSENNCSIFGYADLTRLVPDHLGKFDRAVSFGLAMDPEIMLGVKSGPTRAYASLYTRINHQLDSLSALIESEIKKAGWWALALPASARSDLTNMKGDFPHKTAATRAGLGWVGKNVQLVTKSVGPWLRLSTVLTDLPLPSAKPVEKSLCGQCDLCVISCPAGALHNVSWAPGLARAKLMDVHACDFYKKVNYLEYNQGHNCGICSAACPLGQQTLPPNSGKILIP